VTHRKINPEPQIISTVIEQKGNAWNEETRKVVRTDALRILEALIAEYGVENAVKAIDKQGMKGSAYLYLLKPLHAESVRRRQVSLTAENTPEAV